VKETGSVAVLEIHSSYRLISYLMTWRLVISLLVSPTYKGDSLGDDYCKFDPPLRYMLILVDS
jgi:hypothetical protein